MLSDRLRPNIEAAHWVIDEVRKLEQELADAYLEMRKIRPVVKAIFDRAVWDRSEKPNVELRHLRCFSRRLPRTQGWGLRSC